jgi:ketosteroid isomerase-like protein
MPGASPANPGNPTPRLDTVQAMQAAAFEKDWERFKTYFADDVYYRVGNVLETTGPEAVAGYLRSLPSTGLTITRMDVRGAWEAGDVAVAEYTMGGFRGDGRTVEYPCVDIYRFRGNRFQDWRVYAIEPTFIKASGGVTARRPAGAASAPKGGDAGAEKLVNSFQFALRDGDAATATSLLSDDAVVRVADNPEARGPQAILEHVGEIFSQRLKPSGAEPLDVWHFDGAMLVEMVVQALRVSEGRAVEYPCVESYRFGEGKIREWRIYPIEATLLAPER